MVRKVIAWAMLGGVSMLGAAKADTLNWLGSTDHSWNTGSNWSTGNAPSTASGAPDDVTFGGADLNGDALTLDAAFYINDLTLSAVDWTTTTKDIANPGGGKITFQADGVDLPTITAAFLPITAGNPQAHRGVRLASNITLAADTTIVRTGPGSSSISRQLLLSGVIDGNANLTIDNDQGQSSGATVYISNSNTFTGDVLINGGIRIDRATGLGDASNTVTFGSTRTSMILFGNSSSMQVDNDFVLDSAVGRNVFLYHAGSGQVLTLTGSITGGKAGVNTLDLMAHGPRNFILTSSNQTFFGNVDIRYGSTITLAGANASGAAWENVGTIGLNHGTSATTSTSNSTRLLLRGDFTLNASLDIIDGVPNSGTVNTNFPVVTLGQVNDGINAFDAIFNGRIRLLEKDYLSLQLSADAGGSATFNGAIYGASGWGFDKVGDGRVVLTNRVSASADGVDNIGAVTVHAGTLQVDSDTYYADTTVNAGATLGGNGTLTGATVVSGVLNPGASVGHLDFAGDLSLYGVLNVEVSGVAIDTFDVSGLLILGDQSVLAIDGLLSESLYVLAGYGSRTGMFADISDVTSKGYAVVYDDELGQIRLETTAVIPTPAALPGALALLAGVALRRRRMSR